METLEPQPHTILVVDDDHLLRDFFEKVLTNRGFVTVGAHDAKDAMQLLDGDDYQFSLVFVNFLQKGNDFLSVATHINESEKHASLPVVAVLELSPANQDLDRIYSLCKSVIGRGDFELPRFYSMVETLIQQRYPD